MKRLLSTLLVVCALGVSATYGEEDPVLIDKIKFDKISSTSILRTSSSAPWTRIEIMLVAKENPDLKANNTKWIRNIEVEMSLVYKDEKASDKRSVENMVVMKAKARLFGIELNKKTPVVFYIPGEAYSIYRIKPEPFAWHIELSVNGVKTALSKQNLKTMISKTILKSSDPKKAFDSYTKLVGSAASTNEGVLMPLPACPFNVQLYEYSSSGGQLPIPTYIKQ